MSLCGSLWNKNFISKGEEMFNHFFANKEFPIPLKSLIDIHSIFSYFYQQFFKCYANNSFNEPIPED